MPCARCDDWIDNPRWLAAADFGLERLAHLRYWYWDEHGNAVYTVCRHCLVVQLRCETDQLLAFLDRLSREQVRVSLQLLSHLANKAQREHLVVVGGH